MVLYNPFEVLAVPPEQAPRRSTGNDTRVKEEPRESDGWTIQKAKPRKQKVHKKEVGLNRRLASDAFVTLSKRCRWRFYCDKGERCDYRHSKEEFHAFALNGGRGKRATKVDDCRQQVSILYQQKETPSPFMTHSVFSSVSLTTSHVSATGAIQRNSISAQRVMRQATRCTLTATKKKSNTFFWVEEALSKASI